jgi:hypothetical protein
MPTNASILGENWDQSLSITLPCVISVVKVSFFKIATWETVFKN